MNTQYGLLSVENENLFSLLKKWLYTEPDIVFRELVSNALDAIEKYAQLQKCNDSLPKTQGTIIVTLDSVHKQLRILDNGIGMSEDEIHKYINQIAFSGATEFIHQTSTLTQDTMIGHFGVGFYSAFMLSDDVSIETKSYHPDIPAICWHCKSDMHYTMSPCDKLEIGTSIIIQLDPESPYLKNPKLIYDALTKYFVFAKTEIYLEAPGFDHVLINTTHPIWKLPNHAIETDAMHTFYKSYFQDPLDPLFWVQFESVDIGLRGILFFRNIRSGTAELDGTFKIYHRGVYVGENIPELIPKFVNLQNGIIECDDLPLVVSRSHIHKATDKDSIFSLIYETLVQEITIIMNDFYQNKRDQYECYWPNLNAFVKYGVLQNKIFASVMMKKVLFEDLYGKYYTLKEYETLIPETSDIYYASDKIEQARYISLFKKCNFNALLFDHVIDQPFMRKYEILHPQLHFTRIDSNIEALFKGTLIPEELPLIEALKEKFYTALSSRLEHITLEMTHLSHTNISALIINDEKARRMADILEIYGLIQSDDFAAKERHSKSKLLINLNHPIIQFIVNSNLEHINNLIINQLFDLALMSQQTLDAKDIENFINRSELILTTFTQIH